MVIIVHLWLSTVTNGAYGKTRTSRLVLMLLVKRNREMKIYLLSNWGKKVIMGCRGGYSPENQWTWHHPGPGKSSTGHAGRSTWRLPRSWQCCTRSERPQPHPPLGSQPAHVTHRVCVVLRHNYKALPVIWVEYNHILLHDMFKVVFSINVSS